MPRKIGTSILILLFIPFFVIEILIFTFYTRVLNEDIYKAQLDKHGVYDLLYDQAMPQMVEDLQLSTEDSGFTFSEDDMHTFLTNVFPKSLLKSEINSNIDNVFLYIKGKKSTLEIKISLVEVKRNAKPELEKLVENQFKTLPTCSSPEDFDTLSRGELTACFPPGMEREEYMATLKGHLRPVVDEFVTDFPDSFDLTESLELESMRRARGITTRVVNLMVILFVILIIFLAGIIYLLSYSAESLLRGVGFSFFVAGILASSILFILKIIALRVSREVTTGLLSSSPHNNEIFYTFTSGLISGIIGPILYLMMALSAVGVFLFLSSFLVKKWQLKSLQVQ